MSTLAVCSIRTIPSRPSRDEAREALKTLAEPLVDFPFAEPCHLSAALAMQLTAVCRPCIEGPVPMGGITATAQGSGKGHLAKVIAIASTGRECAFWPQPSNEEEERKRLLAIGLQGDSIVCIDNVTKPFGSGTFAGVMTSMAWKDRILGFSQNVGSAHPLSLAVHGQQSHLCRRHGPACGAHRD